MRVFVALLLLALVAAVLTTFALAPALGWWLPERAATIGAPVDALLHEILGILAVFFTLTVGALAWCVLAYARERPDAARSVHGNLKLELAWTLVPAGVLVYVAFTQLATWRSIQSARGDPSAPPLARVVASQFDWRFRYAGADERFGTLDDLESTFELVVPLGQPIVLELVSEDVIHSFFVPSFRLKQDILPGARLRTGFQATRTGSFDLVCAELCGFGHYKMAGRVRVVTPAEHAAWLAAKALELESNGSEDRP